MYPALDIAVYFLRKAREERKELTPMQVQKLVYLAHGWHLAIEGEPLLDEQVEAWQYGPVIPSLYHEFKYCGARPIKHIPESQFFPEGNLKPILDRVWEVYGDFSGSQLSTMTHKQGSPWHQVVREEYKGKNVPIGTDIPRATIEEHFRQFADSR